MSSKLYVFQISDKYTFDYKYVFIPMAMENNNSSVNDNSHNHNHNRNNERPIDHPPPAKGNVYEFNYIQNTRTSLLSDDI